MPENHTCRTCRWWAGGLPSDMPGGCRRILDVAYTRSATGPVQLASVVAPAHGLAMLTTYGEFGCALWEEKSDA